MPTKAITIDVRRAAAELSKARHRKMTPAEKTAMGKRMARIRWRKKR
jgi:hypothetical protein